MQSVPADFGLSFKTGKIIFSKIKVFFLATFKQNSLDQLGKQVLMMKRNISTFVL
jgi:hypothetical protein